MNQQSITGRPLLFVACLVLLLPPSLRADIGGPIGEIIGLQINSSDSDFHDSYTGRLVVDTDGQVESYFWGETGLCNVYQQPLNDVEVTMLQTAFNNPRLVVRPYYQMSGTTKCLVAFFLIRRDKQGLF